VARSHAHFTHAPAHLTRALAAALLPALLLGLPASGGAQSGTPATPPPAPAAPRSPAEGLERFASLELTPAQRKSIDSLAAAARAAREALVAKREAQGARARPADTTAGPAIGLNLGEAERAEMHRITTEFEAALQRVLTPGQREKLTAARDAMRKRHQAQADSAAKAAYANRPTLPPPDLRASPPAQPPKPQATPSAPPSTGAPRR
jgi:Spy/CpxP family protein refolding chaperone